MWARFCGLLMLVCLVVPGPVTAHDETDYDMVFEGVFRLSPLAGEDLTDELRFEGEGQGTLGPAELEGYSRIQGGPDGCATIVEDTVLVTMPHGTLFLVNEGVDCLDVVSSPGHVLIEGEGTTSVVGGTGAYEGASGSGTWSVHAEVTGFGPGYAEGVFGPLHAAGTFH